MGSTVCAAVADDPELELVGAVDPYHAGDEIGVEGSDLRIEADADALARSGAEVAVDFTVVDAARGNLEWCAEHDVHAVVGTTGFGDDDVADLRRRFEASTANAVIAPNFAIGAVLMMRFAELAAPYFETAEIIELHHDQKVDAPSGTAVLTAQRMADASDDWGPDPTKKEVVPGARGGTGAGDIRIHSLRMRGVVASQEVVLGTTGQTVTIRHDTFDRTSFMPGVLLAVRAVRDRPGLTVGLDTLLGLEG